MVKFFGLILAFALTACSASEASSPSAQSQVSNDQEITLIGTAAPTEHPVSGLKLIDVTVDTGEEQIGFYVELADTPEAQAKGLMFRTELNEFGGMLFPSRNPQIRSFWMKNTPLPLDIIFIGTDNRIINIETAVPYSLDSVRSDGLAIAVFEIAGGRAEELEIEPGDLVTWELPK